MTAPLPTRRDAIAGLAASGAALATASACAQGADGPAPGEALSEPGWTAAPALPIRVQEIYPAALAGGILVAGGLSPDVGEGEIGISNRVFGWAPGQPRWRELPRLPLATHHPNCVGVGNRVFAIGGFTARNGGPWSMTDAVRVFDADREQWRSGPDLPGPWAETVAATLDDGTIHVVTGRRPAGLSNAQWSHHADTNAHLMLPPGSDAWTTVAPAPTARNSASGAVLDERLHVIGGRTVNGGNTPVHEVYDPFEDRWETRAPLPEPQAGPRGSGGLAAAALNGRIHVFGGEWFSPSGGGVYDQVWAYDPEADAWSEASRMPTARHGLGALRIADAIYTIAGAAAAGGNRTSAAVEALSP